jgi:hypothetical protein
MTNKKFSIYFLNENYVFWIKICKKKNVYHYLFVHNHYNHICLHTFQLNNKI